MKNNLKNLNKKINIFTIGCIKYANEINVDEDENFLTNNTFINIFEKYLLDNVGEQASQLFKEDYNKWFKNQTPLIQNYLNYYEFQYNNNIISEIYGQYFIVKSKNDLPNNINIQEEKLLKGYKIIPNLSFIIGNKIEVLDKEYAKYSFLIHYLTNNNDSININPALKKFIDTYKTNIDKILSLANYHPKFIAAGNDAFTYDISDHFVLKLFTDQPLYNEYIKQLKSLHENTEISKTESMIHDVGILGKYLDVVPIYYVIMEKMVPIKSNNFINDFYNINNQTISFINDIIAITLRNEKDFWSNLSVLLNDKSNHKHLLYEVRAYANELATLINKKFNKNNSNQLNKLKNDFNLNDDWLETYCEEIIFKLLTKRGDLAMRNLGISNTGYLRFYDSFSPGYKEEFVL